MIKKCPIPYLRTNNIVVTIKPWNLEIYDNRIKNFDGERHLISESAELNLANLDMINPRFIFFPHWSKKLEVLNQDFFYSEAFMIQKSFG